MSYEQYKIKWRKETNLNNTNYVNALIINSLENIIYFYSLLFLLIIINIKIVKINKKIVTSNKIFYF